MEDYARTAIPEEGFKGNFFVLFLLFSFLDVLAQSICFFHAGRNRTPPQLSCPPT
jgi:hypothetical protein